MPHPKQMVATIDAYLAALAAGDLEGLLSVYAEDASVEDPVGSEVHRGQAALRTFYERAVRTTLRPRRTGSVKVAGTEAAFAFTLAMPDVGRRLDVIEVMAFDEEGKVTAMKAYWGGANLGPLDPSDAGG